MVLMMLPIPVMGRAVCDLVIDRGCVLRTIWNTYA